MFVSTMKLYVGFYLSLTTGRYGTSLDAMFLVIGYRIGWYDRMVAAAAVVTATMDVHNVLKVVPI